MSRLYTNSASIVQAVEEKKQSLKKYCHSKDAAKIGKAEYLLACETLKYSEVLDEVFEESEVDALALDVSVSVLKVIFIENHFTINTANIVLVLHRANLIISHIKSITVL